MNVLNILLIEDNIEDATWVDIQLKEGTTIPYVLHTCQYFSKAMKLIEENTYSLIMLDLCLPDSKGLDTVKMLVKSSNIPVIIYTGINDPLIKEEAFKAGISDYLIKDNTTAEDLNRMIKNVFKNNKLDVLL